MKTNSIFIIIFSSSLAIYLLSCFGLFDALSESGAKLLYNTFGYTNRWSKTYGPPWFVNMVDNISSLGSRELVLIISIFMLFYIKIIRGGKAAQNFLFTVGVGIILILIVKSITSKLNELTLKSLLVESLSNFPSGHTFIATVLYLAIARYLSTHRKYDPQNKFLYISAAIIITIVGISRFVGSGHTITEVIAGWSLGLCWYSFAQIFLTLDHKTVFNK